MWTIKYQGEEQSFEAVGIGRVVRQLVSQGLDTVQFSETIAAMDAAAKFAVGETVQIRRDGVPWFTGRVMQPTRSGSGANECIDHEIYGPWWYLDSLVFQQTWRAYDPGVDAVVDQMSSHVFLGQKSDGTAQTTVAQIREALEWGITCGAPFVIGTIDLPDVYVPITEVRDRTCADVVRQMLKWHPDAVTWWDYSAEVPKFCCRCHARMGVVNMALGSTYWGAVKLRPRHDLVVPSVWLKYEVTNTVDGRPVTGLIVDKYPVEKTRPEFGTLFATIQMTGYSTSSTSATLSTINMLGFYPSAAARLWWWRRRLAWLNGSHIVSASVGMATRSGPMALPRELVDGQIAPWMTGVRSERDTISATIEYRYKDDKGNVLSKSERVSANVIATDAPPGTITYATTTEYTPGESVPDGLAMHLYGAASVLHWDGSLEIGEAEVGTVVASRNIDGFMGRKINLYSGMAEWRTMGAIVQSVWEDLDAGKTRVILGTPGHLGAGDLVELLGVNRTRFPWTNPLTRTAQASPSGNSTVLGQKTGIDNASGGGSCYKKMVMAGTDISASIDVESERPEMIVKRGIADAENPVQEMGLKLESGGPILRLLTDTGKGGLDVRSEHCQWGAGARAVLAVREYDYCKGGKQYRVLMVGSLLRDPDSGAEVSP
jgi:hypothetical protein